MNLNKQRIQIFFLPILLLLIASACALPWVSKSSENIVASTPPVVEVQDLSPFQNIGCVWQTDDYAVCNQDSIPKKMGCDTLSKPSDYLNLLDPERMFVLCSYYPHMAEESQDSEPKGLWEGGCKAVVKQRILAYSNGDYLLISDLEDLQYNFSPVTTPEQALGYAVAATGSEARYDLEALKGYRILTDELQETTVQQVEGGFQVVLFRYQACGCGPHTTFMQTIKVSTAGDIEFVKSTPAFENPEEDDLCVD